MHKLLSLFAVTAMTALIPFSASADRISPEQALNRLSSSKQAPSRLKAQKSSLRLAKTVSTPSDNEEAVYLFESAGNNAFAVLSADDMFPTVLGYGDAPLTDADGQLAPGLAWLLNQYAAEIEYVRNNPSDRRASSLLRTAEASESDKTAIEPLLTSKWNQNSPYNANCPTINKTTAPTGCVATALAQVMYFHKYPAKGTGTCSYTVTSGNSTSTGNLDLSTITFDWDNMTDTYGNNSTSAAKSAVAALMQACGAAVNSKYQSGTTGTKTVKDVSALGENFGYSSDMRYYYRDFNNFTEEEWGDLVYGSLSRRRPVLYGGGNEETGAGHSFVCDGYSEGKFHFNWGWSGNGDGYFSLSGLNPNPSGTQTGENGRDYNGRQLIIVDAHPAAEGETFEYPQDAFMGYQGDLKFENYVFSATGTSTGFYNKAPQTATFDVGILAIDAKGEQHPIYYSSNNEYKCGSGKTKMTFKDSYVSGLAEGNYKVYPAYRLVSGNNVTEARIMTHDNDVKGYLEMHKTGNTLYLEYDPAYDAILDTPTAEDPDMPSSVDTINESNDAHAEYINLNGIRVENPAKGLYIRRQGSDVKKVMTR